MPGSCPTVGSTVFSLTQNDQRVQESPRIDTIQYPSPPSQSESQYIPEPIAVSQTTAMSASGGNSFSVQDGIGIATALIPLVSLFKGSGHKAKPRSRSTTHKQLSVPNGTQMNQNTRILLIGVGAAVILGISVIAMSRK